MHYWSDINSHWMRIVSLQHPWSLNVWCGIVTDCVIGPYFFEGHLNNPMYANFLRGVFPQLLKGVPLDIWMQHDGAPPYDACSRLVMINQLTWRSWITCFLRRWIEREGPSFGQLTWSNVARFLPFMKVMLIALTTAKDMKNGIRRACAEVTSEMLPRVRECFRQRILKCILVENHHFVNKHFLFSFARTHTYTTEIVWIR